MTDELSQADQGWTEGVRDPSRLAPSVLAYLGDAVCELFVRTMLISAGTCGRRALHQEAVSRVRAESQAKALQRIQPELTQEERDVVRRGRNARGNVPRGVSALEYRYSTAFEALLGYLYLKGRLDRVSEILSETLEEDRPCT
ncbi:MAG: ribonuclease III [Firmicutes bacterium]|nr:ribonuclease III [Bacillota bacterium]